ncbi:site-specific integrase [Acetobacter sp. AN02]|uniref:tyrosine-type recombinase/integrase n=1 Tax=Acetobacter sp. AN02 TaxID=2894186 RepID=UPI0024342C3B|nr:site-specific integrase [Acetobacter sp. AN02]MDG6095269.1 site-specific integrase [Acetobacter sp. AN02]
MKQIQKRGNKFAVTVRLNGYSIGRTFPKKSQALEWASRVEIAINDEIANPNMVFKKEDWKPKKVEKPKPKKLIEAEQRAFDNTPSVDWPLKKAIKKYMNEDLDNLRGYAQALLRLKMWLRSEFADVPLKDITAEMVHDWKINRRVRDGKLPSPSTIRNDLYRLSVIFETAKKPKTKHGWGLTDLKNPVKDILLPSPSVGRERRLHGNEEERLRDALLNGCHGIQMLCFFEIALATGMRKSEILKATRDEILEGRQGWSIKKTETKNHTTRVVHLSDKATNAVMRLMNENPLRNTLFTISSTTVDNLWKTARRRAGCDDLRIHDLRHEAISRLADAGLSIGALASMSGHKTSQMLLRYVNAKESDIREKLALIS